MEIHNDFREPTTYYFTKINDECPTLLVMDDGNKIILGKDIYKYFKPKQISLVKDATNNDEPDTFSLGASFSIQYLPTNLAFLT